MISPLMWQSIPAADPDAWLDFLAQHEQWHRVLASITRGPIFTLDDMKTNLAPHAELHGQAAAFFRIAQVEDLTSYDLNDPDAFIGFMALHAMDHERLRRVSGL